MKQNLPQRKQIRLKEYDYSEAGYYFVTICTQNKKHILSKIINAETNQNEINIKPVGANCVRPQIVLLPIGNIIDKELNKFSKIYDNVILDKYIIMPNHIHLIIQIIRANTVRPYNITNN